MDNLPNGNHAGLMGGAFPAVGLPFGEKGLLPLSSRLVAPFAQVDLFAVDPGVCSPGRFVAAKPGNPWFSFSHNEPHLVTRF